MALRDLFESSSFQYRLPDITTATDGASIVYDAEVGGLAFSGSTPGNITTVTQTFTGQLGGNSTVSDPFTLVFQKDLQTNIVTVICNPIEVKTEVGTNYTHTVPCLNTGIAEEFQWVLTPSTPVDPNYASMIPTGLKEFIGDSMVYNLIFTSYPATWTPVYMPMGCSFTVHNTGTIVMTVRVPGNGIEQNQFCTLTRPDATAGSTAIIGQYMYAD